MRALSILIALTFGCAQPTPGPGAEICLDGECMRIPNAHAEFLTDWCEYKLPDDEAQELNEWSRENMALPGVDNGH